MPPKITLIVAMSQNRVIGRNGALPWHLPDDLKRFKSLTMGHAIVMGRKTFESIGRLLPGRRTVILTRQHDFKFDGAAVFATLVTALASLRDETEIFIVGGGEIYREALPRSDRIHLTLVHQITDGDTTFPEIPADFIETSREDHPTHSWITLDRKR